MKLLIVDDEKLIREVINEYAKLENFEIMEANNGEEALDIVNRENIDLIILDIMMPKMDGMEVLDEIRERTDIPILMLTALGDSSSELSCLRHGASDFVSKPFHYDILVERVKNLLRLTKAQNLDIVELGILTLDPIARKVYVKDEEVILNNKEFQLLELLVNNQNIVLSREKILDRIWGYDYEGDIRTIDTHVKMIRAGLKEAGNYIKTIRGVGYSFEVEE